MLFYIMNSKEQIPTCDFEETLEFYYINIGSFNDDNHALEISYKYNFLILTIIANNNILGKSYLKEIFISPN